MHYVTYEDYEAAIATLIVCAIAGWLLIELVLFVLRKAAQIIHGRTHAE